MKVRAKTPTLDLHQSPTQHIRSQSRVWRQRPQGPALMFHDSSGLAERDWESVQRIYNSEKKHSPSEVDKFGIGIRSFFTSET